MVLACQKGMTTRFGVRSPWRAMGATGPWSVWGKRAVFALALAQILLLELRTPYVATPFERVRGDSVFMGRLPAAAWALLGLLAVGLFVARTVARRAALFSVVVLASMPAWFLPGRLASDTMISLAAFAVVLSGVGLAVFDDSLPPLARAFALVVASAVSVIASPVRGIVVTVLVPSASVVLAALLGSRGRRARTAMAFVPALVALVHWRTMSLAALLLGPVATSNAHGTTFDCLVAPLAYSLVPWTPLLPMAFASRPSGPARLAMMVAAALGVIAQSALAFRSGPAPLVGVSALAAIVGIALSDLEDLRRPSFVSCLVVVAVTFLVIHDSSDSPSRILIAIDPRGDGNEGVRIVDSARAIGFAMAVFAAVVVATSNLPRGWLPVGRAWILVMVGGSMGSFVRFVVYPKILASLSPGAAIEAWMGFRHADEALGLLDVDARVVPSAVADATTYFETAERAAAWLVEAPEVSDSMAYPDAMTTERRWLAVGVSRLPPLNAAFRALRGVNVPIAAGADDSTLLAVSAMTDGLSRNPLDQVVLSTTPRVEHPVAATLGERIELVGWSLRDDRGREIEHARPGRTVHVRVVMRVRASEGAVGAPRALSGHCTFLHVERKPSRISLEHTDLPYPIDLWREGDVIVDDFELKAPATSPGGGNLVYWGMGVLPCHDDRRMPVTAGEHDGHHRIGLGRLEVR